MVLSAGVTLVLGVISPYIVSWLTSSSMSIQAKQLVAFAVSIVLAIIIALGTGMAGVALAAGFVGFIESFAVALPVIFTVQQLVYNLLFRDTEWAIDTLMNKGVGKHKPPVDPEEVVTTYEDHNV